MTGGVRGKVGDRWKGAAGGCAERGKQNISRDGKQKHGNLNPICNSVPINLMDTRACEIFDKHPSIHFL